MKNSFENFKDLINNSLYDRELQSTKNPNIYFIEGRLSAFRKIVLQCAEKSKFNRLNKYSIWENEYENEWRTFIKFELIDINSFFDGYDDIMDEIYHGVYSYEESYKKVIEDKLIPQRRLFDMLKFLGVTDKNRSKKFAQILSEKTQISHFRYEWERSVYDQPRGVIEGLIGEYKLRSKRSKFFNIKQRKQITASDISDFIFCPASFSIKNTYEVPSTEKMQSGTNLHEQKYLEKYILNLINKKLNYDLIPKSLFNELQEGKNLEKFSNLKEKYQKNNRKYFNEISKGFYSDLLKSKIIFRGHKNEDLKPKSKKKSFQELIKMNKIFSTKDGSIVGIPDYIFKRENGEKFILEEKHTWQEKVNNIFENHEMQALSYMNMIEHNHKNLISGYVIYFTWGYFKGKISSKEAKLYKVDSSSEKQKKLKNTINNLNSFIKSGEMKFAKQSIEKCIGCTARVFCNHINGDIDKVTFPYKIDNSSI